MERSALQRSAGPAMSGPVTRMAVAGDLDRLVDLERICFSSDRIARRSWRRLLRSKSAEILIVDGETGPAGCLVVLFHRDRAIARIYSIAIDPKERHHGLARSLVRVALDRAEARDCALMRLETRADNPAAQRLFLSEGFRQFGRSLDYYEDGTAALRFERSLWQASSDTAQAVMLAAPYYGQTLDFTCGPSALMMAMGALRPGIALDRKLEIRLWREATTVFMAAGHGGCGPYGLALAAHHRGFGVAVHAPPGDPMFRDSVRDPAKKEVIAIVEDDMRAELTGTGVQCHNGAVSVGVLRQALAEGKVPLVLISLYRLHGLRAAHWVTVVGFDGHVFRIHDPLLRGQPEAPALTVSRAEFERIYRYGRNRETAAVILSRSSED
jgi:ribosomal protein S18 acetylase RimI-like enzyme